MKTTILALATATLLGGLTLGTGSASAAPMPVNGVQAEQLAVTQVRMMHGDRMTRKRMMRHRMMRHRMMRHRMMHRM